MTHKIEGLDGRPVSVTGGASVARPRDVGQENRADDKATKPARSDIEITPAARQLAALEKVLAQIPVVDEARVKTISSAIADGRYQVDTAKVAERLMRSDAELTEAQRRER
jgi:negative regulator of flagellin synthesis FlgM